MGNTEVAAKMIQKLTGADSFRIATVKEYPTFIEQASHFIQREDATSARAVRHAPNAFTRIGRD